MSSSIHHPETADAVPTPTDPRAGIASALNSALYVVATPIGNLDDLSPRALEVLRGVDLVACEDTRKSKPMLRSFGVDTACVAFHAHNEAAMTARLLARLHEGQRIALVSDAGTPAISDPGARLARAALDAGLRVTPVPGASAVTALASAAGLADGRFLFEGFLPARSGQRRARIEALDDLGVAVILFEAPHRIEETAADLLAVLGPDREIVVGRELTKLYEQIVLLRLGDWPAWLAADPNRRRGEFVLALHPRVRRVPDDVEGAVDDTGAPASASGDAGPSPLGRSAMRILCEQLPPRQAAKLAARISGDDADALYAFRAAQRSRA
ncbi:MAG: 16S rRNA (cytidine(1402)-2'-O)-methyltransferase [Lautropia sp.]